MLVLRPVSNVYKRVSIGGHARLRICPVRDFLLSLSLGENLNR